MSEQLKAVRLAAVIKKIEGVYMQLDASVNAFGVLEGFGVLTRLIMLVNASNTPRNRHLEDLKLTKEGSGG
jgi:hypothetical protein